MKNVFNTVQNKAYLHSFTKLSLLFWRYNAIYKNQPFTESSRTFLFRKIIQIYTKGVFTV